MSDGGRGRASLGVEVWKSSQKVERTAVRRSLHRLVRRFSDHSCVNVKDHGMFLTPLSELRRQSSQLT
jgi:hypothetical protein